MYVALYIKISIMNLLWKLQFQIFDVACLFLLSIIILIMRWWQAVTFVLKSHQVLATNMLPGKCNENETIYYYKTLTFLLPC